MNEKMTVKISKKAHENLKEMSQKTGISIYRLLETAIEVQYDEKGEEK